MPTVLVACEDDIIDDPSNDNNGDNGTNVLVLDLTDSQYSALATAGGHVFQLIFTHSTAITEHGIIGNTTGNWLDGDIHFGFNLSRVFGLK